MNPNDADSLPPDPTPVDAPPADDNPATDAAPKRKRPARKKALLSRAPEASELFGLQQADEPAAPAAAMAPEPEPVTAVVDKPPRARRASKRLASVDVAGDAVAAAAPAVEAVVEAVSAPTPAPAPAHVPAPPSETSAAEPAGQADAEAAPGAVAADSAPAEGSKRSRNRRRGRRGGDRGDRADRPPRPAGEDGDAEGAEPGEMAADAGAPALPKAPPVDVGELFAEVLSGAFDVEPAADEAEAAAAVVPKRVLAAEPDAPKLHKVLAQAGVGSRRDMEQMIVEGRVTVNGEPAHIGQRISLRRPHRHRRQAGALPHRAAAAACAGVPQACRRGRHARRPAAAPHRLPPPAAAAAGQVAVGGPARHQHRRPAAVHELGRTGQPADASALRRRT